MPEEEEEDRIPERSKRLARRSNLGLGGHHIRGGSVPFAVEWIVVGRSVVVLLGQLEEAVLLQVVPAVVEVERLAPSFV